MTPWAQPPSCGGNWARRPVADDGASKWILCTNVAVTPCGPTIASISMAHVPPISHALPATPPTYLLTPRPYVAVRRVQLVPIRELQPLVVNECAVGVAGCDDFVELACVRCLVSEVGREAPRASVLVSRGPDSPLPTPHPPSHHHPPRPARSVTAQAAPNVSTVTI